MRSIAGSTLEIWFQGTKIRSLSVRDALWDRFSIPIDWSCQTVASTSSSVKLQSWLEGHTRCGQWQCPLFGWWWHRFMHLTHPSGLLLYSQAQTSPWPALSNAPCSLCWPPLARCNFWTAVSQLEKLLIMMKFTSAGRRSLWDLCSDCSSLVLRPRRAGHVSGGESCAGQRGADCKSDSGDP